MSADRAYPSALVLVLLVGLLVVAVGSCMAQRYIDRRMVCVASEAVR